MLSIIGTSNVNGSNKNRFTLENQEAANIQQKLIDRDNADYLALLAYIPFDAESQLQSLEKEP